MSDSLSVSIVNLSQTIHIPQDLTYLVGIVPIVVLYLLKTVMIFITLLHMDLMATECQRSILIFLVSNYPTFENIQGRFLEKIRCSLQGRFQLSPSEKLIPMSKITLAQREENLNQKICKQSQKNAGV